MPAACSAPRRTRSVRQSGAAGSSASLGPRAVRYPARSTAACAWLHANQLHSHRAKGLSRAKREGPFSLRGTRPAHHRLAWPRRRPMDDAATLAAKREPRSGESAEYSKARTDLLADEIELQRQIDALAAKRAALPPGPVIEQDYRFHDMNGETVTLAGLFGTHDTLVT